MEHYEIKSSEGFSSVYKELADIIGPEYTFLVYKNLRGQQLTFPKRLYTPEFIVNKVAQAIDDNEIRRIAMEFDYTEKYLRQLLKQQKERRNNEKKSHQND